MKAHQIMVIIIVISLPNLGCHYASQIGPTYDADRPIMLGKVQTIGGTTKQLGIKKNSFNISHYSGHRGIGVYKAIWEKNFDDSVDENGELKKNIDAPDNVIRVDKVNFGSVFFIFATIFLINIFNFNSTTGIQGSIYEGKSVNRVEDCVKTITYSGEKP